MKGYLHVIIDLAIALILVVTTWKGYRKGLVLGICGLLALIVAYFGASFIAETYAADIESTLRPFMAGLVDGVIANDVADGETGVGAAAEPNGGGAEASAPLPGEASGNGEVNRDVLQFSLGVFGKLGILGSAAEELSEGVAQKFDKVGEDLKDEIARVFSNAISHILLFIISFLLIVIIFIVIGNILNLAFKLPGLNLLNGVGGAVMGLAKGIFIILIIAWIISFLGFIIPEDAVSKSALLRFFMGITPFPNFTGAA